MDLKENNKKAQEDLPYCKYQLSCRPPIIGETAEKFTPGKIPQYYECLPREVTFAFMPPAYYARGYSFLPVYKRGVDFSQFKKLFFLEDPDEKVTATWFDLRRRIPFPVGRVIDLPGTRDMKYKNYCVRNLTPESAMLWRKSIEKPPVSRINKDMEKEDSVPHAVGCPLSHPPCCSPDSVYRCRFPDCPFRKRKK